MRSFSERSVTRKTAKSGAKRLIFNNLQPIGVGVVAVAVLV